VTPALLAECRDDLARGITARGAPRSPATVVRYLAALSHALTVAVKEWGWLEANPLAKVSKPKEPRGRVRYLADDERERLLNACRESANPFLYTAVVLALSTGARRTEIWSLRWPDVDLQRGVITLHETKNGERRVLPLVGHAHEQVKEHARVPRLDTDLLFPSRRDPKQPIDLRKPWETALQKAGIADFRWHDLRHCCASYLAMNGATLAEIAEVLGHKTLQMVRRYAHLSEAHTARVVAAMNAKIFGGP
jgi:integrase